MEIPPQAEKKPPDELPFPEGIVPTEFRSYIRALGHRPDKLVKEVEVSKTGAREKLLEELRAYRQVFRDLEERYGIAVPRLDLIVGKEKGQEKIFLVRDRIYGKLLSEMRRPPADSRGKFDAFYESMARYYADIYREGGLYWRDIHTGQIVYGHKKGERKKRVYIVDTSPDSGDYYTYRPHSGENDFLFGTLEHLASGIKYVETAFYPPARLTKARLSLRKLLDSIPSTEQDYWVIRLIRERLEKDKNW